MSLDWALDGIASALQPLAAAIPDLQIYRYLNANPTPPSIDVYPGDPFQDSIDYRRGVRAYFTVRARVATGDQEAASMLLLSMLEPEGPTSVQQALELDQTLGSKVDAAAVAAEGVSGFRLYPTSNGDNLLGAEWRLEVLL